jgi:uridine kinase
VTPTVVGIAGGTASGKTTMAEALQSRLGGRCLLLTHDRYYHSLPAAFRDDPTRFNFDHPDSLDTARLVRDLHQLRIGHTTSVPNYDFSRHARVQGEELVAPAPIIVVEGILALSGDALSECYDLKVFVHAPDDIRLIRRIRRDVRTRGRAVEAILRQWERTVRPMHQEFVEPSRVHADLVLDGTTTTDAMVCAVLGLIGE